MIANATAKAQVPRMRMMRLKGTRTASGSASRWMYSSSLCRTVGCSSGLKYFKPQNTTQTRPRQPMAIKAACQPQAARITGSSAGVTIAPTLVPALNSPVAMALSPAGNHSRVVFTQAG
ncbi:hypothetical protein D3C75_985930 [compost metagenome]